MVVVMGCVLNTMVEMTMMVMVMMMMVVMMGPLTLHDMDEVLKGPVNLADFSAVAVAHRLAKKADQILDGAAQTGL